MSVDVSDSSKEPEDKLNEALAVDADSWKFSDDFTLQIDDQPAKSAEDISDSVLRFRSFNPTAYSMTVRNTLSSSYGNLTKDSFKRMDRELQTAIGYTIQQLNRIDNNWSEVVRSLNSSKVLQMKSGSCINRKDEYKKSNGNVFATDGSARQSVINEVHSWFARLLADSDVLRDTTIDVNRIASIVGETGASVNSFESLFHRVLRVSKKVMDLSVLRYPDIERPYFKVYHIRLNAWRFCERTLFIQRDSSGIVGSYQCICYKPRPNLLAKLKTSVIDSAVKEAVDLFK